jgi:hypothetical protein
VPRTGDHLIFPKIFPYSPVRAVTNRLDKGMKRKIFPFAGRGQPPATSGDPCRIIECSDGTVLALVVYHGRIGFVHSYCRRAMMDRWGIYCDAPFRRMSDPACSMSYAEPLQTGLFVFRAASLEIIREQDWMRQRR